MKRLLVEEQGAALLISLGALVIISILGATALTVASGSLNLTMWDRSSNQALNIAEAGFDQAVARARAGSLTGFSTKLSTGEASITVRPINDFMYEIKSVGAQPNFANPKARRAVAGTVTVLNPYNVLLATSAAGTVLGNTTVVGPLYVYDVLRLSGTAAVHEGPLFIKDNPSTSSTTGDLIIQSASAEVGSDTESIYCFIDGTYPSDRTNFHALAIDSNVPDLSMPVITGSISDMIAQRADSQVILDDDYPANPPRGNQPLIIDKNTADFVYPNAAAYPSLPHIKWTKVSRLLEIKGKVFNDGLVTLGSNQTGAMTFQGKGTIVANGDVTIASQLLSANAFPDQSAIGLVTGYQVMVDAKTGDQVNALLYGYQKITFTNRIEFVGSLMSNILDMQNNPTIYMVNDLAGNVPPGMPEVKTSSGISGWHEVQP